MEDSKYILTIAGFDPSGGAGILADFKTFFELKLPACAVITGNTIQTHLLFKQVSWIEEDFIFKQLEIILTTYSLTHVKIGLVKNFKQLEDIIYYIYCYVSEPFIVWDPVLFSSTGFEFHSDINIPLSLLNKIDVITPNAIEFTKLWPIGFDHIRTQMECMVYVKGGHRTDKKGTDTLYMANNSIDIVGEPFHKSDRHGSGCVFSSALTGYHALGYDIVEAAARAKKFTELYLLQSL